MNGTKIGLPEEFKRKKGRLNDDPFMGWGMGIYTRANAMPNLR
jgi:hypothetical protein